MTEPEVQQCVVAYLTANELGDGSGFDGFDSSTRSESPRAKSWGDRLTAGKLTINLLS